jgi:hypothetical protein
MNFTPTNSEVYYGISLNNYQMFHDAYKEITTMTNGHHSFDVLSHTKEENEKFIWYEQVQRQAMMICIVFQAFAIEAFVNFIAVNLYEEEYFFGQFEIMKTQKKINKIFSEKLKNDFAKHDEVKELVELSFDLRDKLAHFKSKRINLEELQNDPESYNIFEYLFEHYNRIDEVINAYPKFKGLVNTILGYDIFDTQMNNLNELIATNIQDIFKKTLF